MFLTFLDTSFASVLQITVWCLLPLYGTFLGLTTSFFSKMPSLAEHRGRGKGQSPSTQAPNVQFWFYLSALVLVTSYRGYEGGFFQGQLVLTAATSKLLFFILSALGIALGVAMAIKSNPAKVGGLGLSVWSLGPVLATLWGLLPLVTQLATALLILELVGVCLIWALASTTTSTPLSSTRGAPTAPGVVYALILFV